MNENQERALHNGTIFNNPPAKPSSEDYINFDLFIFLENKSLQQSETDLCTLKKMKNKYFFASKKKSFSRKGKP